MLSLRNINRVYRTDEVETTALDNISLDVEQGEFVAIMGPSGCGKSTLLNLIGMLDRPDSGSYRFGGRDVSGLPDAELTRLRKRQIGFIFQNFNLIDELTAEENVGLALVYQDGIAARERRARVARALEAMGVAHRARHLPAQMSGGQQQRVAVARALVGNPPLLLADEPTGNLDSRHGEEIMTLLTHLNRNGTTIIMVTHSDAHAAYAHRIVQLFDGRVLAEPLRKAG
jgi:putative ABC transport system ATP-binding protein